MYLESVCETSNGFILTFSHVCKLCFSFRRKPTSSDGFVRDEPKIFIKCQYKIHVVVISCRYVYLFIYLNT